MILPTADRSREAFDDGGMIKRGTGAIIDVASTPEYSRGINAATTCYMIALAQSLAAEVTFTNVFAQDVLRHVQMRVINQRSRQRLKEINSLMHWPSEPQHMPAS